MTAGLPASVPFAGVDALQFLEILLAGEHQMLVAGEYRIDAVDAGHEERGVLHHVALLHVDAGMRQRDHDVGALLLDLGHPGLGRLDDVARPDIALEVLVRPPEPGINTVWKYSSLRLEPGPDRRG